MKKPRKKTTQNLFGQTKNVPIYRLTKTQVRQKFASLIDSLATNGGIIEITDHGKIAAVMLAYRDYVLLLAQARLTLKPKIQLRGSAELVGDLEAATKNVSKLIIESVKKTPAQL